MKKNNISEPKRRDDGYTRMSIKTDTHTKLRQLADEQGVSPPSYLAGLIEREIADRQGVLVERKLTPGDIKKDTLKTLEVLQRIHYSLLKMENQPLKATQKFAEIWGIYPQWVDEPAPKGVRQTKLGIKPSRA